MNKKNNPVINTDKCKGCELCVSECPVEIIAISDEINIMGYHPAYITDSTKCTGCIKCAISCPDAVITVYREE
ncbi:MAG: 4Fe-4S binding protein [Spirochaetes bacterium]|nr:4Fe-4S binding protein [Spirochaetota bacterium]